MNHDLPDEFEAADQGLRIFLASLSGAATSAELAGEEATLAMFRTIRPSAGSRHGAHRSARRPRQESARGPRQESARRPRHRSVRAGYARRAGWLVTVTVALCGGFAAAGYAAVLPAPVQHVAHSLFGFAGLPNGAPGSAPRRVAPSVPVTSHRSAHARPSAGSSSPSPSVSASPVAPLALSATAANTRIPAGGKVTVSVLLTSRGRAVPGAALRLIEWAVGHPAWQVAAQATTSAAGRAVLVAASLTVNAKFLVTGPSGSASGQFTVVVIPLVSISVTSSGGHRDASVLTASCPLAQRNDVVELQALSRGKWRDVRTRPIGRTGLAAFTVSASKRGETFRVVLLATAYHGQSASRAVTVPGRRSSGQGGQRGGP